jgi:NAD(P)-dependent dehydrogenase (short-subunit alcohol dehydrogenase family)
MDGKCALVTGGSSGIGKAIARAFVAAGAKVAITGRREDALRAAAEEVGALALPGDARDPRAAAHAVAECVLRFGALTTLVNNAGVIGNGTTTADTSPEEWAHILSTNVDGTVAVTRAAIPELRRAGGAAGAAVLNLGSVAGTRPYPAVTAYCVSKAAVDMLTRCLALELAPAGVRVNAIAPGVVVTNLHTVTNSIPDYAGFLERAKTTHPLGFVGMPEDVADLALFLCSDASRWLTGAIVPLDGGRALMSAR